MACYAVNLRKAHAKYPDRYAWPIEGLESVVTKMRRALIENSYNHDGYAFAWTCKELGFKHTRQNIEDFLTAS